MTIYIFELRKPFIHLSFNKCIAFILLIIIIGDAAIYIFWKLLDTLTKKSNFTTARRCSTAETTFATVVSDCLEIGTTKDVTI